MNDCWIFVNHHHRVSLNKTGGSDLAHEGARLMDIGCFERV